MNDLRIQKIVCSWRKSYHFPEKLVKFTTKVKAV